MSSCGATPGEKEERKWANNMFLQEYRDTCNLPTHAMLDSGGLHESLDVR